MQNFTDKGQDNRIQCPGISTLNSIAPSWAGDMMTGAEPVGEGDGVLAEGP